eukprot:2724404-Rhodomonas_salina.1
MSASSTAPHSTALSARRMPSLYFCTEPHCQHQEKRFGCGSLPWHWSTWRWAQKEEQRRSMPAKIRPRSAFNLRHNFPPFEQETLSRKLRFRGPFVLTDEIAK